MKTIVHIAVNGYVDVEVEATDINEAKQIACEEVCDMDFGPMRDIEWYAVGYEDENGMFEFY